MNTMPHPEIPRDDDGAPSRRVLMDIALERLQDIRARWDRLEPRQRRAVVTASADFLADLRAAGVTP